jgi:guanylate kinase
MISPDLQQQLDIVKRNERNYWPADNVRDQLHNKNFIMVVGPAAVGKSSLMNEVAKIDTDFARVKNTTTRPQRSYDEPGLYNYVPHTNEGLGVLLDQIKKRELVQYAVYPTTGYIYGTFPGGYPAMYSMLDTQSQVVATLSRFPFKNTYVIGVVTDPTKWKEWLTKRDIKGSEEYVKRVGEAITSLEWLVAQPDNSINWVYNHPNDLQTSAHDFIAAIRNHQVNDLTLRGYALEMLSLAHQMKE